jgi:hypothetical protein
MRNVPREDGGKKVTHVLMTRESWDALDALWDAVTNGMAPGAELAELARAAGDALQQSALSPVTSTDNDAGQLLEQTWREAHEYVSARCVHLEDGLAFAGALAEEAYTTMRAVVDRRQAGDPNIAAMVDQLMQAMELMLVSWAGAAHVLRYPAQKQALAEKIGADFAQQITAQAVAMFNKNRVARRAGLAAGTPPKK